MYYIIPQEVANGNAIILVHYLAQQFAVILCVMHYSILLLMFDGLNDSYHEINKQHITFVFLGKRS